MKHNDVWKTAISLALALLLALSCVPASAVSAAPAAAGFTFRNGVTWDSTVEQVLASEGAEDEEDYYVYDGGDFLAYTFGGVTVCGEEAHVDYLFVGGRMVGILVHYSGMDYAEIKAALGSLYGEPAETDPETLYRMVNFLYSSVSGDGYAPGYAGWRIAEDTLMYLVDDGPFVLYYDESRALALVGGGEPAPGPESGAFPLGDAVTWDTAAEQLPAALGVTDESAYAETESGGYHGLMFNDLWYGGELVNVGWMFYDGRLTLIMTDYRLNTPEAFAALEAKYAALYGEPALKKPDLACALLNLLYEGIMDKETVSAYAGWALDDGTWIFLVLSRDELIAIHINILRYPEYVEHFQNAF